MKVEEAIVDLLLRHNCVVVPEFGGFVAQSSGAVIDRHSGFMLPPRKSILFNRQLVNNDGLLISHLATVESVNYAEAQKIVKNHTTGWQVKLQEGKRVCIDKIGYLFLDAERNIGFEPDRFFNLLLQSYGLNKVHFLSEEEVKMAEYQNRPEKIQTANTLTEIGKFDFAPKEIPTAEIAPKSAAKIVVLREEPQSRKIWKYAIAAALLPFAFYTYWIPTQTTVLQSGMISMKDFNPTYQSKRGVYLQKTFSFPKFMQEKEFTLEELTNALKIKPTVYAYKFDSDFYIPVKMMDTPGKPILKNQIAVKNQIVAPEIIENQKMVIEDLLPKEEKIIQKIKNLSKESKTNIPQYIIGAYSSVENAQTMVNLLRSKGLSDAKIVDTKNGLTRVSAGGSDNIIEMEAIADKAIAAGYNGWTLK